MSKIMQRIAFLLPILGALWYWQEAVAASTSQRQDISKIETAVKDHLMAQDYQSPYPVDVSVQRIDPRLRLPSCEEALHIEEKTRDLRATQRLLRVSCSSPSNWQLYVKASIALWQDVVVAKHLINRDQALRPSDLRLERKKSQQLRQGYFDSIQSLTGLKPKYAIRAGEVISPNRVTKPKMVQRGREVTLIAASGGIAVRTKAKALENATLGDVVSVQNLSSKKRVQGVVIGHATVQVQ